MKPIFRHAAMLMMAFTFGLGGLVLLPGCHSAPGREKQFGTYYRYIRGTSDHVAEATRQVMGEMGYLAVADHTQGDSARLQYRTSFGSVIDVKVEPVKGIDAQSRVGVNVNPGDSEGLSQTVLQRIADRADGRR